MSARRPTCVTSAPPLGRPGWRSWWRSRGSVESGDPSPSWARPAHTRKRVAKLHSLRTAPDEHKPNPYLSQHTAKDLKLMPVWMWLHAEPANAWEARGQARLNPYGRPSGSSDCRCNRTTSQSQTAITLCRSWIAETSTLKSFHKPKRECKTVAVLLFLCFPPCLAATNWLVSRRDKLGSKVTAARWPQRLHENSSNTAAKKCVCWISSSLSLFSTPNWIHSPHQKETNTVGGYLRVDDAVLLQAWLVLARV